MAGTSNSSDGDVSTNRGTYDYWVVRLSDQGSLLWETSLGGSGSDRATSIAPAAGGGVFVAGYSYSSDGDLSTHRGVADYWVVRLSDQGSLLWETSLGGSGSDRATSIVPAAGGGGLFVAGFSTSSDGDVSANRGTYDYWVVKLY